MAWIARLGAAGCVLVIATLVFGGGVEEAEFVEWVEEHAIAIEDWEVSDELAAQLDRSMEGKRIVYLGEPDHYFAERTHVRTMMMDHLASRGFRWLCREGLGCAMEERFAELLEPGCEAETIQELVHGDEWEVGDRPEDMLKAFRETDERVFTSGLRSINEALGDDPVRICGFDLDLNPGMCLRGLTRVTGALAGEGVTGEIRTLVASIHGTKAVVAEQRAIELEGLVEEHEDELRGAIGGENYADLVGRVRCFRHSMEFLVHKRDSETRAANEGREPFMFERIMGHLERWDDDERVMMTGHNMHLVKNDELLSRLHVDRGGSVGTRLDRAMPDEVFTIWMLYDHGELFDPYRKPEKQLRAVESDPDRIESLLSRVGECFLLPLHTGDPREAYLDEPREFSNFDSSKWGVLTRHCDAIVFIEEISTEHGVVES